VKVAVVGTGRVGLVTSVAFAHIGHDVVGVDVDEDKISRLRAGVAPFFEPGLDEALVDEGRAGRLAFTTDANDALAGADVIVICVGTPARADGEANLLAVETAVREIARHARDGALVVEKSTVPAGTAERVQKTLVAEGDGRNIFVASNPEFLREGMALRDALEPDRIVFGVNSERARELLERLYEPILRRGTRLIVTDIRTAELAKHASNAFLATKISYMNALARVCERAGADVTAIAEVMGADPRIAPAFLGAGLGYGGYCLPKDVAALERLSASLGYPFRLLHEVARANDEAVDAVVATIREAVWNVEGKRIAILGLAFKADTDDVRSSPALTLASRLIDLGAEVIGFDPRAGEEAQRELPSLLLAADVYEAISGAHCLVIGTDWPEFATLDLGRVRALMAAPVVVDGRNQLDPSRMADAGFWFYSIGRPPVAPAPDVVRIPEAPPLEPGTAVIGASWSDPSEPSAASGGAAWS
jgi:UDPglucose 6-dehydrogenase